MPSRTVAKLGPLFPASTTILQEEDEFDHLFTAVSSNRAHNLAVLMAHVLGPVFQAEYVSHLPFTGIRTVQMQLFREPSLSRIQSIPRLRPGEQSVHGLIGIDGKRDWRDGAPQAVVLVAAAQPDSNASWVQHRKRRDKTLVRYHCAKRTKQ